MARKLTFWLLCAIAFSVPLVFFPEANLIFEIPKVAVFRVLVLLTWVGLAWQILAEKRLGLNLSLRCDKLLLGLVGLWIAVTALAVAFSVSPSISFWGSYYRQQGLLQILFYLMFFGAIVCALTMSSRQDKLWIERMIKSLCLGSFVASVAAIGHYFIWDVYRAFGTMGHPNFLGAYLVMCLPFCSWLAAGSSKWKLWFWAVGILVDFVAIFLTFGKAAWIGVVVAGVIWLLFSGRKKAAAAAVVVAVVVVCAGALMAWFAIGSSSGSSVSDLDASSYESASDRLLMKGDSLASSELRLDIWEDAISVIADRPILGIGPETFGQIHKSGVPDRAHNEILHVLVESGIVGFFAYFSLLFYAFLVCYRRRVDRFFVACAASLAGLFATNMFGFSTTVHYVIWWAILAIVCTKSEKEKLGGRVL